MPRNKRQSFAGQPGPVVVWFQNDLRLADNPALARALQLGRPVLPVYIWAPDEEGAWPPGAASRWWLHQSLAALQSSLLGCGSKLVLRKGPSPQALQELVFETGACAILWNTRYEPASRQRDLLVRELFQNSGVCIESFSGELLHEPASILNSSGEPFRVFSAFWRRCLRSLSPSEPIDRPRRIRGPKSWPRSVQLAEFGLEPRPDWAGGLRRNWQPGETEAAIRMQRFVRGGLFRYGIDRNHPGLPGTSRLSPYLHFGEISARQIWHAIQQAASGKLGRSPGGRFSSSESQFLAEIGWREFSHYLLYHFPQSASQPLRTEFERFQWRENPGWLRAWQRGKTGYPLVDAGMRELWATGWMHNRVRMVVASFLVKDLLISWQEGARWFWDTLVDADLAQNTLGWQWCAGCGADAAPFFRVFNPATQADRFDRSGDYVRRWVPELARLPASWIHQPHAAPPAVLERAGVKLGHDYPKPIVSHAIAREIALERFRRIKRV